MLGDKIIISSLDSTGTGAGLAGANACRIIISSLESAVTAEDLGLSLSEAFGFHGRVTGVHDRFLEVVGKFLPARLEDVQGELLEFSCCFHKIIISSLELVAEQAIGLPLGDCLAPIRNSLEIAALLGGDDIVKKLHCAHEAVHLLQVVASAEQNSYVCVVLGLGDCFHEYIITSLELVAAQRRPP